MKNFYFTFGSDPKFPYGREDYVVVMANDRNEACRKFKEKYPNRPGSDFINCAFIYSEAEFNKFKDEFYPGVKPIDTIK